MTAALCPDRKAIFAEYPELEDEDVTQALSYADTIVDGSVVDLRRVG